MGKWVIATVALLGCSGCAHLEFTKADTGKGVPFYMPIPYVLLTTNADCSTTGSVLYIPDVSTPRFVIPHPGYGANNLTVVLSNGAITSFGQQTDTKVPETITALGSLATTALKAATPMSASTSTLSAPATACSSKPARLFRVLADGGLQQVDIPAP